jgi:glycosyltransferase involved in cell wall biosynthesis
MTPKVSIIMPIYNASTYLDQSIQSLLNQTLTNIEIICVNDGSKDNSLQIIRKYADHDARIKIIDKQNGGYGHAMNCGLKLAQGEFIGILEPDDYINTDAFEKLYAAAKKNNCEVVKANYYERHEKTKQDNYLEVLWEVPYNTVTCAAEYKKIVYMRPCIWSAIYKRELLSENNIFFNETPGASYQDTSFAFKVWVCAERVFFLREAYLHYRIDNENSSVNSKGKVFSICDEFWGIQAFINQKVEWRREFGPILQVLKFDAYSWNLDRVSDDYRKLFTDEIALEFMKAEYDGFLNKALFNESRWDRLQQIIAEYKEGSNQGWEIAEVYKNSMSYRLGHALLQPIRFLFRLK